MSQARLIVAVCLCCILVATLSVSEAASGKNPYESAITKARSEIWQAINKGKCGSAAAAITVNGKVVYAEGFGMAVREKSIPVTTATLFNIGSISKVYVAAAVMLLVDEGSVGLDRPVTDYLPEFRMADERYRKITVRMLLNHQSGMPGSHYANSFGFEYYDKLNRETINTLSRARLKHAPGENAAYCNDGFTLAEMIVERVSGLQYIDFLNKKIFRRLGIKSTGRSVGDRKGKPIARNYEAETGKIHPPESGSALGAGGLSSTAADICRFADTFSGENSLLQKASLVEMRTARPSLFWSKIKKPLYPGGLGWDVTGLPRYDAAGIQLLGKGGATGDYSSYVFTAPDKKISVAVVTSGKHSGADNIVLEMLDALLVAKKLISPKDKTPLIPPAAQKLPQNHLSFGGYYAADNLGEIVFDENTNSVTVYSFKEKEKTPSMTLVYNNGYYYDTKGDRYYFAGMGDENYLMSRQSVFDLDKILMQKIKPLASPQSLGINMDNRLWLRRNVNAFETTMLMESHVMKSFLYKELPGYVIFRGVKKIESPEFAGMPFDSIRDQTELTLLEKNGTKWAGDSDMLYSPAEDAIDLKSGENFVKIGNDGYNEWFVAKEGMVFNFTKPDRGRIVLFLPDGTTAYDSAVDQGDAYAAPGSYIECAGSANDLFTIKTRSAVPDK